ncbi:MAG: chemotaxis protein CheW [Bdellovibrionota bacterium]
MSQVEDDFLAEIYGEDTSMFAIRKSLDGERVEEFSEKEQYIGLIINTELFYLKLSCVSEIIMLEPIRFVPGSPKFVEGVINLRGTILPAINLGKLLGRPRSKVTFATRIIIVRAEKLKVGLLVDKLSNVIGLSPTDIEEKNLGGSSRAQEVITQIAKCDDKVVGILNVDRIILDCSEGRVEKDLEESS